MKKAISITLTLLFLLSSNIIFSQEPDIRETEALMSFGTRPAYELRFTNTREKRVKSMLKDLVKSQYRSKLKWNRKAKEYYAEELSASSIYSGPFNLYAKVDESGDGVVLRLWFDLGTGFLNRQGHPGSSDEVSRMLRSFYFDVRRAQVTDNLENAEDEVRDAEKDLNKLVKKNEDLHKDIEVYKEKIIKAEQDILENEQEQVNARALIETRQQAAETVRTKLNNVGRKQ